MFGSHKKLRIQSWFALKNFPQQKRIEISWSYFVRNCELTSHIFESIVIIRLAKKIQQFTFYTCTKYMWISSINDNIRFKWDDNIYGNRNYNL